jgi:diaminohydroxyphosphoribosylaminopyrimidine deaminase/5-amino-6-(5-phosphoribosylamino)uracil reductase
MARALQLAARGEGHVEPNPMVGCVIVCDADVVGEGWHARFGGPHAEVVALEQAGAATRGGTLYVTLEPCCHHGKTPPCTEAILRAGIARVVIAAGDPFPQVDGGGVAELTAAGITCEVGTLGDEARRLLAPYLKLVATARPWVIAKWAMTLDGKLATHAGDSQWISGEASREVVHQLRGRVDAIVVGSGTALADDPLLTARPQDPTDVRRIATRVVVDSRCTLPIDSQLVRTTDAAPLLVAVSELASAEHCRRLTDAGAEVVQLAGETHAERIDSLLVELGRRRLTNVLVEGGGRLLGQLFDLRAIDEVHVFVAPKLAGGATAPSPLGGMGIHRMDEALQFDHVTINPLGEDVYVCGRIRRDP